MSGASIPPSATLTADSELGESHKSSPMLEAYRREEPTLVARLLVSNERDSEKDRMDSAKKIINTFNQQWSK
ncbi:hypothetical protein F5B22DRAFT_170975 [Xylaria bambusicola]|uniref:uncharacterized protein n=1 Tax=Xylaria bambusicola TaxID=326684 RepID=UPI0020085442|nr:uncharacterized protein F5B22DRAFT_170975 [Xylaria bambusicola]KAI0526671.1 hypothetical protein F5B22DRAFT_170975 [Xylaria bambusicola]